MDGFIALGVLIVFVAVLAFTLARRDRQKYGIFHYEDPAWKEGREGKTPEHKTE